ncbi:hypothetical protein TNCV_472911 [Trichonephila clavipes]|nr:hypothetical protein TNCV_472911 [Trichonephila clavipes]
MKTPIPPYPAQDAELMDGKVLVLPKLTIDEIAKNTRFFKLSLPNNEMSRKYQFAIFKALETIEAKKLLPPQLPQTYAQTTKHSPISVTTQTDENITKIKCPPLNLLPPLSSSTKQNISLSFPAVTKSSSSQVQLLPSISSITSTVSPTILSLSLSDAKENIKEQPSEAHYSQKLAKKKTDLKKVKPTTNLKDTPVKSTSLKIAREKDSPNEVSPVSKRSRRRKTSKTSDAMATDAYPSDMDYVTVLASEEDESLLEADFKQMTDNPLKGPLSPISPKK